MKSIFVIIIVISLSIAVWFVNQESHSPSVLPPAVQPVISREDILNATDLKAGIKLAVQQNDLNGVSEWLEKASNLAKEAGLPAEDIAYFQSPLANNYAVFRAKRSLFNDEIEQAYYAVEDITQIKYQYPEAQDLFSKVDTLIKNRNKLIQQIAEQLADGKPVDDELLKAAKQIWKQQAAEKHNP